MLVLLLLLLGCAARPPLATWPYTSWYSKRGTGEGETVFQRARRECIEEAGIQAAPESVTADSLEEKSFLLCMNDAGWCTYRYHCNKGAAS